MVKKNKVIEILEGSTKFKTDVSLLILRFDPEFLVRFLKEIAKDFEEGKAVQMSQGTNAIVLLCDESLANKIKREYKDKVIEHKKDLVAYTIMFPKKAIETPGIIAFITDLFAKNGINIIEIISCYTDVTFLIKRKDLFKVMDLLGEFIL